MIVTDGFTGNVSLKLLEGTIKTVLDALRAEIAASARGKLGGLLIRPPREASAPASTPTHTAVHTCSGSGASSSLPTATPAAERSQNAVRLLPGAGDIVARLRERLEERVVASARFQAP